jgi:transcriptional regulator with XRE-family HTH domain
VDTHSVPKHKDPPSRTKLFAADRIDRRVAGRIAARRQELGITSALLDLLLGARDGTVKRLETGRSRITPGHLLGLASILDVSVDWFFAEWPAASPPPPLACSDIGKAAQVRRFAALFLRIADPKVRSEIRQMVRSIAAAGRHAGIPAEQTARATKCRDAPGLRRRSAAAASR